MTTLQLVAAIHRNIDDYYDRRISYRTFASRQRVFRAELKSKSPAQQRAIHQLLLRPSGWKAGPRRACSCDEVYPRRRK